jgi:hypothetical protein
MQFTNNLSIIEKDEEEGWAPEMLAKKIGKIVECKKTKQIYVTALLDQILAVV